MPWRACSRDERRDVVEQREKIAVDSESLPLGTMAPGGWIKHHPIKPLPPPQLAGDERMSILAHPPDGGVGQLRGFGIAAGQRHCL